MFATVQLHPPDSGGRARANSRYPNFAQRQQQCVSVATFLVLGNHSWLNTATPQSWVESKALKENADTQLRDDFSEKTS